MATLKDIAKAAGVSLGTVHRVMHNQGRFSEETAKKVRKVIEDLDYKPNIHARTLTKTRNNIFGAVIPYPDKDMGYWKLLERGLLRAKDELSSYSSDVKLFYFDRHSKKSCIHAINDAIMSQATGLLLAPVLAEIMSNEFSDDDIPDTINRISYIGEDSTNGGQLAAKLMSMLLPIQNSEQSVLVIEPFGSNYHLRNRVTGFVDCIGKKRADVGIERIKEQANDERSFHKFFDSYFSNSDILPAGIYLASSSVYHLASYLNDMGGRYSDIPLIGYDLIPGKERYIENGTIDFILTQQPEEQGFVGIMTLYDELVLKKDTKNTAMVPLNIITKENLSTFEKWNN